MCLRQIKCIGLILYIRTNTFPNRYNLSATHQQSICNTPTIYLQHTNTRDSITACTSSSIKIRVHPYIYFISMRCIIYGDTSMRCIVYGYFETYIYIYIYLYVSPWDSITACTSRCMWVYSYIELEYRIWVYV